MRRLAAFLVALEALSIAGVFACFVLAVWADHATGERWANTGMIDFFWCLALRGARVEVRRAAAAVASES